jgi:hypothetical protein
MSKKKLIQLEKTNARIAKELMQKVSGIGKR